MERVYTISEVTTLTDINESTLRNWEREFAEFLSVARDEQGSRIYTQQGINQFKMIQLMRKKGLSINAIKNLFTTFKNGEKVSNEASSQVVASSQITKQNTDTQAQALALLNTLQNTLQNLPEQIKTLIHKETLTLLNKHQEETAKQIKEIHDTIQSRLQKYKRLPWWMFWKR